MPGPIHFDAPQLLAVLDGRKTQMRIFLDIHCEYKPALVAGFKKSAAAVVARDENDEWYRWPRTYAVGDLVWVQESFRLWDNWDDVKQTEIDREFNRKHWPDFDANAVFYEADQDWRMEGPSLPKKFGKLRPSIQMQRWASRVTLKITDVRIERLQDISENDCLAEGGAPYNHSMDAILTSKMRRDNTAIYSALWDTSSLNRGHKWDSNPWVVAYEFYAIEQNIDSVIADNVWGR